jgi:hypothetical protein
MKSALRIIGLLAVSLLVACQRPPVETPAPPPSPAAVTKEFFSSYRGDFRQADRRLLSEALASAVQSAVDGEKESVVRVKASEFPNDKPLILEGEIFAGLYEGFTGYEIAGESVADGQAIVQVRFRNEPYDVTWTDEILLVDEDGWKIDDVRYAQKKAGLLSLREVLREFEAAVAAEAAALSSTP